ncbi:NPR1/NH1-interacting protein [Dillenia turbinata]|uniref:NPR1/NH1-interacting protein n=1 Tax=Dillenia turbinata TaxID=194707 RepID=A0AAN8W8E8_9MAGN
MALESHGKKRKLCHIDEEEEEYQVKQQEQEGVEIDDDDDDDDEIKMEKFYAIVRNIRDARIHFMNTNKNNGSHDQHKHVDKKIVKKILQTPSEEESTPSAFASAAATSHPSFHREDFLDDPSKLTLLDHHQSSETKEGGPIIVEENTKEALDLNLSL